MGIITWYRILNRLETFLICTTNLFFSRAINEQTRNGGMLWQYVQCCTDNWIDIQDYCVTSTDCHILAIMFNLLASFLKSTLNYPRVFPIMQVTLLCELNLHKNIKGVVYHVC